MGKLLSLSIFIAISCLLLAVLLALLDSVPESDDRFSYRMAVAEPLSGLEEEFRKMSKTALVLGYTGATGAALVKELADRNLYSKVKLVGRRKIEFDDNRKEMEQISVDFDKLEENHGNVFDGVDHVFCCMGTTRGQSGADGFRKVDHDYIMASAKLAKKANCSQFHHQSSTGANKNSSFLYPQVKGQVEAEINELSFERAIHYRPALLMSPNREKARTGEAVIRFMFAGISKITNSGSIPVQKVARAMLNVAISPSSKAVQFLDNDTLHKIADRK